MVARTWWAGGRLGLRVRALLKAVIASSFRQALEPRGNIDPIAVDPFSLDHYIAQVEADAKLHLAVVRQVRVFGFQFLLDLHRTTHGIDHTGKLGQQVIAGRVHHPAAMLLNKRGHDLPVGSQGADGGFFILTHETAIAFDISTEDGGELTFHGYPSSLAIILLTPRVCQLVQSRANMVHTLSLFGPRGQARQTEPWWAKEKRLGKSE